MDLIFFNGNIYSLDHNNSTYTAIGVKDGKITFLGEDDQARKENAAEKIDLKGQTMLPGFIDSHLHMLNYAFVKESYDMRCAGSIEEIVEAGREILKKITVEDGWIYGRGWNENNFIDEKRSLNRFDLDKISTTRPILFIRTCGHAAAVNTKALNIVMSLREAENYIDQIDLDRGILTEASVKLCYNAMKEPTVEQLKEMIISAQADINMCGITAVETDDFLSLPGRNGERIMQAYRELEREGKLSLRVREQVPFTGFNDMKAFIDRGYRTGDGGEYYQIGPVKLYEDGSLGAKTALMNEPYEGEENCGVAVHDEEELNNMIDYAYRNDMQILCHAIGDKASDMVCAAYEQAIKEHGQKERRLAINHLQVIGDHILDKMEKNHIMAYIQPVFVASDKNIVEQLIGEKRAKNSYMWKTMMNKGIMCCGGSDAPVERFSVLENIQIAVTRDCLNERSGGWHPEEKLSVEEAVRLFTINNAYAAFSEKRRGSLEIGKDADMVVLSEDIFKTEPHHISEIKVLRTIVGGRTVYAG